MRYLDNKFINNTLILIVMIGLGFGSFSFTVMDKTGFPSKGKVNHQNDLELIRERILNRLMEGSIRSNHVRKLIRTNQPDGSWPDINYADTSLTGFAHERHLRNLVYMSRAYRKAESAYHHHALLKRTIHHALDFWLAHDFLSANWWWNQIGTPGLLVDFLLLMDGNLTVEQRRKTAEIVSRASIDPVEGMFWGARPGGDRIKISAIACKLGLFERNTQLVGKATRVMAEEVKYAEEARGLQEDLSFHHRRDGVTSTLSYGLGYANVFVEWASILYETQYSFPEEAVQLLVDFFLDGICQAMVYGKYPDPGSKNRSISRKGTLGAHSAHLPQCLLEVTSYREQELQTIAAIRRNPIKPDLSGTKFFWQSEYFSHQRPDYFTSVRMFSSRNHNIEQPYNSEGIKNHHYADGSNFLSRTGKEYYNIFPVWDWQKIPGTTIVQKPDLPGKESIQQKGLTDFVGGVTDGHFGVAVFDFQSPHDPLEARKAWFFFDREYVCMGASIRSASQYPVVTTVNQCLLKGSVKLHRKGKTLRLRPGNHALDKVNWVYHDRIAYIFPEPTDLHLSNQEAAGSWYSINKQHKTSREQVTQKVFTLWQDHGIRPEQEQYLYIIVPGIRVSEIASYNHDREIHILENSPKIQAVRDERMNLSQVVFYDRGNINVSKDLTVSVDHPGLLMVKTNGKQITEVAVADPSRKLEVFRMKISAKLVYDGDQCQATWNEQEKCTHLHIKLPTGGYAGKSVVIAF
jgi:chondroitin AC lyase